MKVFGLLFESVEQRETAAMDFVRDFDVPDPDRANTVAELVSTDNVATRLKKAETLKKQSLHTFRSYVRGIVSSEKGFLESDLLPRRSDALPRFMRADGTNPFDRTTVLAIYQALSSQESIIEALDRLFRLPVELPHEVMLAFQSRSVGAKRELIKSLLGRRRTPLFDVHLGRLLTTGPSPPASFRRLANLLTRNMLRSISSEVRAYLTVVSWAESTLLRWNDQKKLVGNVPISLKLGPRRHPI